MNDGGQGCLCLVILAVLFCVVLIGGLIFGAITSHEPTWIGL